MRAGTECLHLDLLREKNGTKKLPSDAPWQGGFGQRVSLGIDSTSHYQRARREGDKSVSLPSCQELLFPLQFLRQ